MPEIIELPAIAFLGAGSMAGAIVGGLLAPHVKVSGGIRVTNRSRQKAREWSEKEGVTAWAQESDARANLAAIEGAGIVVVAVKPLMVVDLLREISGSLEPGTIVVSVAAGVKTSTMEAELPDSVSVVRTMPNTPALVGRAVTGIAAGARASDDDLKLVERLFSTVGSTLVLDEDQIDAVSTISGSGPAYVYYFIEQLESSAHALGFSAADAALMVRETFAGAIELLDESGEEPSELRRRVTSPKGTTERAIAVFDEADIEAIFRAATQAALARASELAAEAS